MIVSTPSILLAAAGTIARFGVAGPTDQSFIDVFVATCGHVRAKRWDAAFLYHAGFWSHFDDRTGTSSWPLPATTRCHELARFARREHVLSKEAPQAGDVFLLWSPRRRVFVRTGILIAVEPATERLDGTLQFECHTIEGGVTPTARLDGDRMGRVARFLSPANGDRTIRWTAIEARELLTRRNDTAAMQASRERDLELGSAA
jgi:hypothetical protein